MIVEIGYRVVDVVTRRVRGRNGVDGMFAGRRVTPVARAGMRFALPP
jgi:hypothetical protein